MSPNDCPRCRPATESFADDIDRTWSKCLCGQRGPGLLSTLFSEYQKAAEQVAQEQAVKAQAIHEYRLVHDEEYKGRVEAELQAAVKELQEKEQRERAQSQAATVAIATSADAETSSPWGPVKKALWLTFGGLLLLSLVADLINL